MNKLSYKILNINGKSIRFYDDGEPLYTSGKFDNITYFERGGKRFKSRPYNQWTSMTNRCLEEGQHKKNYKTTLLSSCSEDFKDFDKWMDWAKDQAGFMCEDKLGNLYQQDKDIVSGGNYYSKETCVFVPPYINSYKNIQKIDVAREFFDRFLCDDFSSIDERVVEKLLEDFSHEISLSKAIDDTMTMSKYDIEIKKKSVSLITTCKNTDEKSHINFVNGKYNYSFRVGGKLFNSKQFDDVFKCVVDKLTSQIREIENFINDTRHVFSTECGNEAIEILKKLLEKILSGEIKLKKYVLVDY